MRCILAVLIVFMHSFTCYNGGWAEPDSFVDIPVYKWMSRISFAFTLQAFVFISGYLFAFQRIELKRVGGRTLVINKLKRLILPSVIFSAAYFAIFLQYKGIGELIYKLISGCGHMWYLPMLFWCFIGGLLLEQIKIGDGWKLALLVVLNVFIIKPLPMQLGRAVSYMLYFYMGFVVYKHSKQIKACLTPDMLVLSWVSFIIVFMLLRPMRDMLSVESPNTMIQRIYALTTDRLCLLIYAAVGILAFYLSAVYFICRHELKSFTINLAKCCFGIYLFQQFVLQLLYYKTSFPTLVGPYWLPWCGFIIALITSYILSVLFLKTKTGRFLIG